MASLTTDSDMQKRPPIITTAQLRRLVASGEPLWLVYVSDDPAPPPVRIAGSLTTTDENLIAGLIRNTPVVFYGENTYAVRARMLTTRFTSQGEDARWYADGLEAWTAAGLPTDDQPGNP